MKPLNMPTLPVIDVVVMIMARLLLILRKPCLCKQFLRCGRKKRAWMRFLISYINAVFFCLTEEQYE